MNQNYMRDTIRLVILAMLAGFVFGSGIVALQGILMLNYVKFGIGLVLIFSSSYVLHYYWRNNFKFPRYK